MKLRNVIGSVEHGVRSNSTTILSALAASGVVTTAYLTGRATFEAADTILDRDIGGLLPSHTEVKERRKEKIRLVWRLYIPATVAGTATVVCIIGAQRVGSRKTAAAQAAFSLSERAFSEYREKIIEHIGEGKELKLRDELAQDRIDRDQVPSKEVLVTGPGVVLCYEAHTGRYFTSDMETLRKAQNDLNARLVAHVYAYLDDFYDLIDLPQTAHSSNLGWESDRMMELEFSTTLTPDGRPCLVFNYNYTKPL